MFLEAPEGELPYCMSPRKVLCSLGKSDPFPKVLFWCLWSAERQEEPQRLHLERSGVTTWWAVPGPHPANKYWHLACTVYNGTKPIELLARN